MLFIQRQSDDVSFYIGSLLIKLKQPKELLKATQRYINTEIRSMFKGTSPDKTMKREVMWAPLTQGTIEQKKRLYRKGLSTVIKRPLVRTGALRDSLRVLNETSHGFTYGTDVDNKGFNYGLHHNIKRPFLFLINHDGINILTIVKNWLNEGVV